MELIYVFIKDYKGIIKNKEYNFGGKFLYTYKEEVLSKEINNNYLKNFFGQKINNITAIIGQNGSGKSTLINFIIDNLVTDSENSLKLKDEAIMVVKENGIYKVLAHSNIIIKNESDFHVVRYSTDKNLNKLNEYIGNDTSIVKFSNVFDLNDYNFGGGYNYIDISTNYLLKNSKNINEDEEENQTIDQLELFRMNEIYKQIEFVYSNDIKELFDFKLPSKIEIGLNEFDYLNRFDDLDPFMEDFFNNEGLDSEDANEVSDYIADKMREELVQGTQEEIFSKRLLVLLIENILFTLDQMKGFIVGDKKVTKNTLVSVKISVIKGLYSTYNENDKIFNGISQIFDFAKKDLEDKFNKNKQPVVDFMMGFIGNSKCFYDYIKENCLQFVRNNKIILNEKQEINKLIEYYTNVFIYVPLLNIKWGELSSGQTALLSLYSRFYYFRASYKTNNIILIDEGELYFHPEWQRKLINNLVKNLPKVMKNKNNDIKIQIICSSNSPFLITDLPKNNVIFLDENNKSNTTIYNRRIINTFGANIHTLLKSSFFMESTMGEFARIKINEVINFLNGKETLNKEEALRIINLIGEPIIKNKLLRMYYDRFPYENKNLDLIYKEKLEKLESIIANDAKINKQELLALESKLSQTLEFIKQLNLGSEQND